MINKPSRYVDGQSSIALKLTPAQPITRDSDDDDSDEEEESKDIKKEFHLGRFCARRTRVFHEFNHWEVRTYMQKYLLVSHQLCESVHPFP